MFDGLIEAPRQAQNLGVRILRIGVVGQRRDVLVHHREGLVELPSVGVVVTDVVHQAGRVGDPRMLIYGDDALVLGLRLQPPRGHPNHPLVVRVLVEHVVHFGDGGNQLVVGGVLIPLDHELLGGRGVTSGGKRLLLFADLLGRIKADLRQKLVAHREIGINLNRFAQNFDGLFLFYLVEVEVQGFFDQAASLRRLGGQRQSGGDCIGRLRSGWLGEAGNSG